MFPGHKELRASPCATRQKHRDKLVATASARERTGLPLVAVWLGSAWEGWDGHSLEDQVLTHNGCSRGIL